MLNQRVGEFASFFTLMLAVSEEQTQVGGLVLTQVQVNSGVWTEVSLKSRLFVCFFLPEVMLMLRSFTSLN